MPNQNDDQHAPIADAGVAAKMFPERTTEEVVADIVASQPAKHGTTLAERLARAKEAAIAGDEDAWEGFARARVSEIGGDFDEMLPGNKPRYTVEENGDVKDHDTGETHKAINEPAPRVPGPAVEQEGSGPDAAPQSAGDQQAAAVVPARARSKKTTKTKKG